MARGHHAEKRQLGTPTTRPFQTYRALHEAELMYQPRAGKAEDCCVDALLARVVKAARLGNAQSRKQKSTAIAWGCSNEPKQSMDMHANQNVELGQRIFFPHLQTFRLRTHAERSRLERPEYMKRRKLSKKQQCCCLLPRDFGTAVPGKHKTVVEPRKMACGGTTQLAHHRWLRVPALTRPAATI